MEDQDIINVHHLQTIMVAVEGAILDQDLAVTRHVSLFFLCKCCSHHLVTNEGNVLFKLCI